MRRSGKRDTYHHGDLRAALVDVAVELIAEKGVGGFSLAEASRRLGVAASAPYRHFADREELLVAAAVRGCEVLVATVQAEGAGTGEPDDRLVAVARGYVRFAAEQRPLFETAFGSGLDRSEHPELDEASQPLKVAFKQAALQLSDGDVPAATALAAAVATSAHGHAEMLQLGFFGTGDAATDVALGSITGVTRALVAGRADLVPPPAGASAF